MTVETPRLEIAAPTLRFPRVLTRGAVARAIVHTMVETMPVRLRYPDGTEVGGGGPHAPVLEVVRPDELYRRLEAHPKIGLGEAYMAGDWRAADGTDLAVALMPFAARMGELVPRPLLSLRGLVDRAIPRAQRNTLAGSRSNISAHYDLSNELFAAFLDPSMSYSSALFDPSRPLAEQDLHEAQVRKVEAILDAAGVEDGSRVLERRATLREAPPVGRGAVRQIDVAGARGQVEGGGGARVAGAHDPDGIAAGAGCPGAGCAAARLGQQGDGQGGGGEQGQAGPGVPGRSTEGAHADSAHHIGPHMPQSLGYSCAARDPAG